MTRGPFYEESTYWVRLTNHQLGQANTGNPQIVLSFLVLGRVNPADPEGELLPVQQYERTMYWVLTEKTKAFIPDNLQRIGFTGSAMSQLDLNHSPCCDLRGKEFALFCKHDEYEGKVREKWSLGKETQAVKPLDSLEMRRLDSMFSKAFVGSTKPQAARTPPPAESSPLVGGPLTTEARATLAKAKAEVSEPEGPPPNDDIPF